jgi:LysR family transcriptional regulator for bpeEF and oprC
MDRIRAMEVFTKVVETGSFTAAARALRLPRASATTLVQALEARLQVRLLHRTTRKVTPSPEGALFYEEASRLLRELGELETGLARSSVSPRGRVRVDVPAAAGRHLLAPAVPQFLARYPDLTLELGSSDRPVDVLDEGVDCVIRGGDLHDDTLVARKLGVLPVLTCAAPGYLARRRVPLHPDQLHEHVFVNFFSAKTGRVFEADFTGPQGEVLSLRPAHQVAANDADTWLALAVAGMGLVQAPCSSSVRAHLQRGELVVVMPQWRSEGLPISVMYPRTRQLAARVRAFVDWVIELYAQECQLAEQFVEEMLRDAGASVSPAPAATGPGS